MGGLFNENNFLSIALNKIGDIVISNLLFILCSIPLVTIGPSLTALHHCTLRMAKGNHIGTIRTFFRAFKENFKQSIIVWLGSVVIFAVLFTNINFLKNMDTSFSRILMYMSIIIFIFVFIMNLYIYPVIAAFQGNLKTLLRNAFIFAGSHLFKTIIMALIWIFPVFITFWDTQLQPLYVFCWFFFLFATLSYANSSILYKMFKPYLGDDDEEDGEKFYNDTDTAYLP